MPDPAVQQRLASLLGASAEKSAEQAPPAAGPIVLTTRIRLARNLRDHSFPGWARESQRRDILAVCFAAAASLPQFRKGLCCAIDEISELDRQILFERHLISRDLMAATPGAGIVISRDQSQVVMVNEEDHLRIQVLRTGLQLRRIWNAINTLDSALEERLDYAYEPGLGYLTACPTNLGTGIRASAMMHLPGLVLSNQMDKVVRAVNQLGLTVRGLFGEGSEASGSIFQISNQTTLGESEENIIKHLAGVLQEIIGHESNARERLIEADASKLLDKIGRACGILQHGYMVTSGESMNLLSFIRLGIDLGLFPEEHRAAVDRLFISAQPGHIQHRLQKNADAALRDTARAGLLREAFGGFPGPRNEAIQNN